jgi:hypothetical protein
MQAGRTFCLSLLLGVPAGMGLSQDNAAVLECLQTKVAVEDARIISPGPYGGRVELTLTNALSWAISAIFVEYKVRTADRADPWVVFRTQDNIEGGIQPGKTLTFQTLFEDNLERLPDLPLGDFVVEVAVLDVGDPAGNQLVLDEVLPGDPWTNEKSSLGCN